MSNNPDTQPQDTAPAVEARASLALRQQRSQGLVATSELLGILVEPIKQKQQQTDLLLAALQSSVTGLSQQFRDLTNLFKDLQINKQDNINKTVEAISITLSEQITDLENRLSVAAELHTKTCEDHDSDIARTYTAVEALLERLSSSKGSDQLGFNVDEPYGEGTLGYTVKSMLRMLEKATSNYINLGSAAELFVTAKTITVSQTLNNVRCPHVLTSVDLEVIRGGSKNDLLVLTSTGEVNLKVSGNIRLKEEYTLMTGRSIVLKKAEDGWEELWRSH